jgi:hypothetical protein
MSCASRAFTCPFLGPFLGPLLIAVLFLVAFATPSAPAAAAAPAAPHPPTARPTATVKVLPPIAQPGRWTARPAAARSVVTARFQPVVDGRLAALDLWRHGHWKRVDSARLVGGKVLFTPRTRVGGRAATYRVRALAHPGLPAVRTKPVRTNAWGDAGFTEEFDGAALGPAWEHRIQFYNKWGGRSCSKGDPSAVALGGGALRVSVLADPGRTGEACQPTNASGDPVGDRTYAYRLNGHVSTQSTFDFQYGVAAARMKFQHSRGQHASFWMQPRGLLEEGTTPWGAEIDVIEFYGADNAGRGRMSTTVHRRVDGGRELTSYGGPIADADRFLADRSDRWWSAYHVFSVEWTPREYVFRIDGQETLRTSQGVSHHPEFLILSMLSSDYELGWIEGDAAGLPQHAYVDWVQVWPRA